MVIEQYGIHILLGLTKLETFFALSDHLYFLTVEKAKTLKNGEGKNPVTGCIDNDRLNSCIYVNLNYAAFTYINKFAKSGFYRWWYGIKSKFYA